jgi:hypothetical protein
VLPVDAGAEQIRACIAALTGDGRLNVVAMLRQSARSLERQVSEMWGMVDEALGIAVPSGEEANA